MLTGTVVVYLMQTLISPALASIMADMSVDAVTVQWLVSGFALVNAIVIPMSAYLMGRFGTRKLFIGALGLFVAGSLITAAAPNF